MLHAERLIRRTRTGSLRYRETGTPEVYGSSNFSCSGRTIARPGPHRPHGGGRQVIAIYADAANSSSVRRARRGSIEIPGPIVDETVTARI